MAVEVAGGPLDLVEAETDVGIEVEDEPIGLLDIVDLAAPAVELDRSHLDAGQQAGEVVDVEIILLLAVLLDDRDVPDVLAEASRVMLLEKAFAGSPLRAADQADRPVGGPDHHLRPDRPVISGEVALGDVAVRED